MQRLPRRSLWLALLLCWTGSAYAAIQGGAGPSSTGNLDVNLVTGLNVRISGLNDLSLGLWSGSGDLAGNDNLCIGRTGVSFFGAGPYRILASGDGEPGDPAAFTLSNGSGTIHYDAFFNDQTGLAGRQPLTAGQALTAQGGSGLSLIFNYLFGCALQNANISVVVPEAQLQAAAGVYTGTLTLLLIPE